jgi:hypothetical protein
MSADRQSPPKGAGKAGIVVLAVIGVIIVTIFVGFNLQHASDKKTGHIDPAGVPKNATDLQSAPGQQRPSK